MADVTVPDRPILVTIPNVELIKAGSWEISTGTWNPTSEDLYAAVAALESPAVRRPVLKLGHTDPRFDGEPTIGYVDNLRVEDNGTTLVGDYCGIPAWLGDVMASAYPDRSIEGRHSFTDQTGRVHPFVLEAVALLGVTAPGVGTLASLQDVAALYGVAASGGGKEEFTMPVDSKGAPHASTLKVAASITVAEVQSSFYSGPAAENWWWIEDMFLDPTEVVVIDDESGSLFRIPFTIEADEIAWGEPQEVKREYVAASTSVRKPLASWASKEESRPAAATTATETSAAETTTEEGGSDVAFTDEQVGELREALSLPEDADDQAVFDAVLEKLTAPEPEEKPADENVSASKVREYANSNGMLLVEASSFKETTQMAERGAQALARLEAKDREDVVSAAIRDGQIAPARKQHWIKQLEADPGAAEVLASLDKGVVPVQEIGHGVDASAGSDLGTYTWPGEPASTKEA
ncbi:phage protease [Rhodococcus sp. NPDC056960]|uniref:phage protease n=1 Tax=Rhodococcus sp. NPDC056960 TaxID=3345982 RepID=UPI003631DC2F